VSVTKATQLGDRIRWYRDSQFDCLDIPARLHVSTLIVAPVVTVMTTSLTVLFGYGLAKDLGLTGLTATDVFYGGGLVLAMLTVSLTCIAWLLWEAFGVETIWVAPGRLAQRLQCLWFKRTSFFDANRMSVMRFVPERRRSRSTTPSHLAFSYNGKNKKICKEINKLEASDILNICRREGGLDVEVPL
jgi:hypothetical protein